MFGIFRKLNRKVKPPAASRFGIAAGVTASIHKDGVVFLNSSTGIVFSANEVGASIWNGVCDGRTVEEISCAVSRHFEAPLEDVRRDTAGFIADLLSEGILERACV